MKTANVIEKLSKFKSVTDKNGNICFYSRQRPEGNDRIVKVVEQENGKCVALPIHENREEGETVAFHAKTIKSLVEFLENK